MQEELDYLRARIKLLEDRVRGLRLSRLVLMNLLTSLEKKQTLQVLSLEQEKKRLERSNRRYARTILERNLIISCLQHRLDAMGESFEPACRSYKGGSSLS